MFIPIRTVGVISHHRVPVAITSTKSSDEIGVVCVFQFTCIIYWIGQEINKFSLKNTESVNL